MNFETLDRLVLSAWLGGFFIGMLAGIVSTFILVLIFRG